MEGNKINQTRINKKIDKSLFFMDKSHIFVVGKIECDEKI